MKTLATLAALSALVTGLAGAGCAGKAPPPALAQQVFQSCVKVRGIDRFATFVCQGPVVVLYYEGSFGRGTTAQDAIEVAANGLAGPLGAALVSRKRVSLQLNGRGTPGVTFVARHQVSGQLLEGLITAVDSVTDQRLMVCLERSPSAAQRCGQAVDFMAQFGAPPKEVVDASRTVDSQQLKNALLAPAP